MSNIERRLKNFEVRIRINYEILIGKNLGTLYLVLRTIHGTSYNYLILDTSESRYCVQFQAS
jgi:hypothetical protein